MVGDCRQAPDRSILSCLLTVLLLGSALLAQDASTGALRGTVLDAQGAAITAADIVAIRVDTGIRYHSATDAEGRFKLDLLPAGEYSARAEAEGMLPQNSPIIRVEIGAATSLSFQLAVAGAKESLTVSDAPPLVETQPSAVSALVDERAIGDLPLPGRRYTDLSLLAPGVTTDPRGLTSSSNVDLAFGGIRGYQSSYLLDGADNNNGFFAQARGRYRAPYQFSNEVVKEFRVVPIHTARNWDARAERWSTLSPSPVPTTGMAPGAIFCGITRLALLRRWWDSTRAGDSTSSAGPRRSNQAQQGFLFCGIRSAHLQQSGGGAICRRQHRGDSEKR